MRDWLSTEFETENGSALSLRHPMDAPVIVGEKFDGLGVPEGKLIEFLGTGCFATLGFDLLSSFELRADDEIVCSFSDGHTSICVADARGARCFCSCAGESFCPHRAAAIYLVGLTARARSAWSFGDSTLHDQLEVHLDAYLEARSSSKALLLACDAGYVLIRDRERVQVGDAGLRNRLARRLGLLARPPARHLGEDALRVALRSSR